MLDRGGHLAEAMLVVSLFEDMNCCERHVSLLVRVSVREQHGTDHCGSLWLMTIIHTTSFDSHEFDLVAHFFGRAVINAQGYLAYRDSNHRSGQVFVAPSHLPRRKLNDKTESK